MANQLLDKEVAKERQKSKATLKLANRMISQEKKRTQFQKGKAAAARRANSRHAENVTKLNSRHAENVAKFYNDVHSELSRGAS
jgi:hypothetical protein